MARRTRDEIMERVKSLIGDRTDDEALEIIEDVNDSFAPDEEDWKGKYEESERSWRQKYKERFFQSPGNGDTSREEVVEQNEEDLSTEGKPKSFDELFEEKEANSGY